MVIVEKDGGHYQSAENPEGQKAKYGLKSEKLTPIFGVFLLFEIGLVARIAFAVFQAAPKNSLLAE